MDTATAKPLPKRHSGVPRNDDRECLAPTLGRWPPEDSDASPSDESNASEPSEETRAGQSGPSRSPSGQVMQAVEQILVSAGRPMKARDITEALGRPTKGDEGRAPIETTRATCKRLVKNGRAVEHPIGVFAARRVTKTQGGDA